MVINVKMYLTYITLEILYTDIPKRLFTPHHKVQSSSNVIRTLASLPPWLCRRCSDNVVHRYWRLPIPVEKT